MNRTAFFLSFLLGAACAAPDQACAVAKDPPPRSQSPDGQAPSNGPAAKKKPSGTSAEKKERRRKYKRMGVRPVHFLTNDGWDIRAIYRAPYRGEPLALLVHGYGAGKAEWNKLAGDLADLGWGTLAIDLRGHGQSLGGPEIEGAGYIEIDSLGSWYDAVRDIEAALEFLKEDRKIGAERVCLVGASIGANLVSRAAAADHDIRCAVLLSPGRNYRGVVLEEKTRPGLRTLAAASPRDPYAYQTLTGFRAARSRHKLLDASNGHGVGMFQDQKFYEGLLRWLEGAVKSKEPKKDLSKKKDL